MCLVCSQHWGTKPGIGNRLRTWLSQNVYLPWCLLVPRVCMLQWSLHWGFTSVFFDFSILSQYIPSIISEIKSCCVSRIWRMNGKSQGNSTLTSLSPPSDLPRLLSGHRVRGEQQLERCTQKIHSPVPSRVSGFLEIDPCSCIFLLVWEDSRHTKFHFK